MYSDKINKNKFLILAGGHGSRMSPFTGRTHKSLLNIIDMPLIDRHIDHLLEVGVKNITISTSKQYYKLFKSHISDSQYKNVKLTLDDHSNGALQVILKHLRASNKERIVILLSDIFFFSNAYANIDKLGDLRVNLLGMSKPFHKKELTQGGILFLNSKSRSVEKIIKEPIKKNKSGYRWNGLACFNRSVQKSLIKFLEKNYREVPLENFFNFLISHEGIPFFGYNCPDFININEPNDLYLASLYRINEVAGLKSLKFYVDKIRKTLFLRKKGG